MQPLSLLMIDIDFFKKINDNYGHIVGDKVLKLVGSIFAANLRLENIASRFGGEEFAILLRGVNAEKALQVGERLRGLIEQQKVVSKNRQLHFTISVGVATFNGSNFATSEELLLKADDLLYEAKQNGRNKTRSEAA
jgi:diguanylate cyclase (GGDEF)-like protein